VEVDEEEPMRAFGVRRTRGCTQSHFSPEELVELVMTAAWENAVSRYNHAFNVEPLGLWRSAGEG
jgi:alkylhydroperoxidase family enzyme